MQRLSIFLPLFLFFALSCGKHSEELENAYPHPAPRSPVALVVAEWNGKPRVLASAFLVDREKGIFLTAKHFTDELVATSGARCKLFFNGRIFAAQVAKVPPLRDAAAVKISGNFDQASFPEPYKVFSGKLRIGEKVFVEGLHPHPFRVRERNLNEGHKDAVVPILKSYYGIVSLDKNREAEIVADRLEAEVIKDKAKIQLGEDRKNQWDELRNSANDYVKIRTRLDHKFSFGGLSGGAVTNARGELIGIITAEGPARLEFDKNGYLRGDSFFVRIVFDTVYATPITGLENFHF